VIAPWTIGILAALSAPFCAALAVAAADRAPLEKPAPQTPAWTVLALCGGAACVVGLADTQAAARMLILSAALVYLAAFDLRALAAPVLPLLAGIALGLLWANFEGALVERLLASSLGLLGFLAIDAGFKWLRGKSGLGTGDALVAAFIGAWLGGEGLAWSVALGASAGAVFCLVRHWPREKPLAFVPALAAGVLLYVVIGRVRGG
jgi:leader peptidase (prepilin peptidase)/N-methyltransferase